jgi:hypothetical protein
MLLEKRIGHQRPGGPPKCGGGGKPWPPCGLMAFPICCGGNANGGPPGPPGPPGPGKPCGGGKGMGMPFAGLPAPGKPPGGGNGNGIPRPAGPGPPGPPIINGGGGKGGRPRE